VVHFGKRALKSTEVFLQRVQTVKVKRRPHFSGNGLNGNSS
jgi:hypothetical protein